MEPPKNSFPPNEQASGKATRSGSIPAPDRGQEPPALNEQAQHPDLERTPDQPLDSRAPTGGVDLLWDIASAPEEGGEETAVAIRQYQCAECGHLNPDENRFCGMCGAARGQDVRYGSSPYLLVAIALLLVVISWRSGWDYGLRVGTPTSSLPAAAKAEPAGMPRTAEAQPSPAGMPAGHREPEAPAVPASVPEAQVTTSSPYPNELQGFTFYSSYLAPLRPGTSGRAAVVRVLGDGGKVVRGWRITPTYTTTQGRASNPLLGPLAELIVRPEGVIPMGAVKFPAVFTHCRAAVSETDALVDVYRDGSGLEYWLYAEDSQWGRKGDLYRIVYGRGRKPTC